MSDKFAALGLSPILLQTLNEIGYQEPTPIQTEAIPHLLAGRDVMGQAQTGTGKTAAFSLPTIQQLDGNSLQVLILTPTRAQIGDTRCRGDVSLWQASGITRTADLRRTIL